MKIVKKSSIVFLLILILGDYCAGQRLAIRQLIAEVYKDGFQKNDTLNYINNGLYPFLDTSVVSNGTNSVKLRCLRNERDFISILSPSANVYLLKISLVKVTQGSLVMNFEVLRTNGEMYTNSKMKALYFVNECEIECTLQGTEWKFSKRLRNKSHPRNFWDDGTE